MIRKHIESLYNGTCNVTEYQSYKKENKSTGYKEVVVIENQPCKLSFSRSPNNNQTETVANVIQTVKLFVAPEVIIKPGSKITITQNNVTTAYKSSGVPVVYSNHQEINLELFVGWS